MIEKGSTTDMALLGVSDDCSRDHEWIHSSEEYKLGRDDAGPFAMSLAA